jgi:histidinol-phosphate aminotransferase
VMGVEPSFVMFRMIATLCGVRFAGVPLEADFSLDADRLVAAMAEHRPALVFIAYPNNPTGNLFDAAAIARIIEAAPGLVVVDEAYHAFAGRSFMPRLRDHPNLLVMRTLSKSGLAGLRLGLLAGRDAWLTHVDKVRLPYNINVLTQLVAEQVLRHEALLAQQAAAIRAERTRLFAELGHLPGVRAFPSDANFILFRVAAAQRVFNDLKRQGVLIKNLHGSHPALAECLRVTVGTPAENDRFLGALGSALGN